MPEPICTVMVGLPAMGKSTRVNEMVAMDPDAFVYSTDNLIEAWAVNNGWSYDFAFSKYIDNATRDMNELLDEAIKNRLDIIWDQTNLGVGKRRKIINRMKQAGYQVRCECIVPPEPSWLDDQKAWANRLANRPGKTIPQNILTNMIKSFAIPVVEEGFDMITFCNMQGGLLGIDYGENSEL